MTDAGQPSGWRSGSPHQQIRVLLLLESNANRRALRAWAPPWFEFIEGEDSISESFDLCLVDERSFSRVRESLRQRKEAADPTFLPVMLVAERPETADSGVWKDVDEVIVSPIRKRELQGRIEVLLRAREASVDLKHERDRLDQFAGIVAHDLRNPLAVAMGYLDIARESGDVSAFDRVDTALDRIEQLVEDVLALARKGREAMNVKPTRLSECVEQAWENVETADATLRNEVDPAVTILADRGLLCELFENLFRNAIEHAGDDVTIRIGLLGTGTGFYVADTGPGIPEEKREQVFEFGYTTGKGTGFGLGIIQQIVEDHGWSIDLTESESGGARFEIRGVVRADEQAESTEV